MRAAVLPLGLLFAFAGLGACNWPSSDVEAESADDEQQADCQSGDVDYVPYGKFVAYGGEAWNISTEIIGIYKGGGHDSLFIEPIASSLDNAYWHLLMPGNHIIPRDTPEYQVWLSQTQGTRDIIKMELYAVEQWPEPDHPADLPMVEDPVTHLRRRLQQGDKIRISGLLVTDNHHSMYGGYVDPFCESTFPRLYCKVHSEIHPYNYNSVLLEPVPQTCFGPSCATVRTVTVVAPRYPDYFPYTHWGNCNLGEHSCGCLRRTTMETYVGPTIYIPAPPRPANCTNCTLHWDKTNQVRTGEGAADDSVTLESDRLRVDIWASGLNVRNPMIIQARYRLWWEGSGTCTPRCSFSCGGSDGCGGVCPATACRPDMVCSPLGDCVCPPSTVPCPDLCTPVDDCHWCPPGRIECCPGVCTTAAQCASLHC